MTCSKPPNAAVEYALSCYDYILLLLRSHFTLSFLFHRQHISYSSNFSFPILLSPLTSSHPPISHSPTLPLSPPPFLLPVSCPSSRSSLATFHLFLPIPIPRFMIIPYSLDSSYPSPSAITSLPFASSPPPPSDFPGPGPAHSIPFSMLFPFLTDFSPSLLFSSASTTVHSPFLLPFTC